MSNFGRTFRISTFGESHGKGVGVIIDGCPPGLKLTAEDIQYQLNRRKPGQSHLTTARDEPDTVTIQSGVEDGKTLGTPISCFVPNQDMRPTDYKSMRAIPRPSHADYTYQEKYKTRSVSGGGRASARETIGRVASGAIAEKWLKDKFGTEIVAFVSSVADIELDISKIDLNKISKVLVDTSLVRCPDKDVTELMIKLITEAKEQKDSVGGVLTCVCRNVPVGLGEPSFDKLEAMLAHAMLSIPATKGFEIGSGFAGTKLRGSQHNDPFFVKENGKLGTTSNNSGGIQGGISNGENIVFRVAFKPVATIGKEQVTVDFEGKEVTLAAAGRHDPCVVPRAVAIVETMAALVIADAAILQLAREHSMVEYEDEEEQIL